MATQDITNWGANLKELYSHVPVNTLNQKSFLWSKAGEGKGTMDHGGKYVTFPVTLGRNLGRGSRGDKGLLPTAGTERVEDAKVLIKRHYYAVEISDAVAEASKSNAAAFARVVTKVMENTATDMTKDLNRQMYNAQSSVMAQIASDSAAAVLTLDTVQYVQVGDIIQVGNRTTGAVTGERTVIARNPTAKTITVNANIVATAATDGIWITGNFGQEIEGVRFAIAAARNYLDIDSAVAGNENWNGRVLDAALAVAGESLFERIDDLVGENGNHEVDVYISTRGIRRRLADEFSTQKTYNDEKAVQIAAGFKSITVNGKACVIDDDAVKGQVQALAIGTWKKYEGSKAGFMEGPNGGPSGSPFELKDSTTAGTKEATWQAWYRYYATVACDDPHANGRIERCADDDAS